MDASELPFNQACGGFVDILWWYTLTRWSRFSFCCWIGLQSTFKFTLSSFSSHKTRKHRLADPEDPDSVFAAELDCKVHLNFYCLHWQALKLGSVDLISRSRFRFFCWIRLQSTFKFTLSSFPSHESALLFILSTNIILEHPLKYECSFCFPYVLLFHLPHL